LKKHRNGKSGEINQYDLNKYEIVKPTKERGNIKQSSKGNPVLVNNPHENDGIETENPII